MNTDNFLVRAQWEHVDTFANFDSWLSFTPEAHARVVDHLAGLPTSFREDDTSEEAKRFDLLALRLQLAMINAEPGYARLQAKVQEIASALLDQLTIPAVRAQQELLDDLAGDIWWQDVTLPMLETMRRNIRKLVKPIDKTKRGIVYTDFEDELGDLSAATLLGIDMGTDFTRFEQKLRIYLNAHEDHIAVQKIRRNRQITATDLDELERVFIESGIGTAAEINRAKEDAGGLGLFLRSLVGLDRQAAASAFEEFRAGKTFTSAQLRFIKEVIDYLSYNGTIDVVVLYDSSPFTFLAPGGPEGLFPEADVDAIVTTLRSINATAIPA